MAKIDPDTLCNGASDLLSVGRCREAELLYREALTYRPRSSLYWFNLGVALQDQRKFDAAIRAYRRSLQFGVNLDAKFNLDLLLSGEH